VRRGLPAIGLICVSELVGCFPPTGTSAAAPRKRPQLRQPGRLLRNSTKKSKKFIFWIFLGLGQVLAESPAPAGSAKRGLIVFKEQLCMRLP
jgi:hypothetical protein